MENTATRKTIALIPCGAAKADETCAAADLYTGSTFRMQLAAATSEACEADEVYIISALHGLLPLDAVVAPYDVKMGDPGSVTAETIAAQIVALGLDAADLDRSHDVYAFLPAAYFAVCDAAFRTFDTYIADVYEAAPGIGYQRGVCKIVAA